MSSHTVTHCPYKGTTSRYFSIRVGDVRVEDAIWVYDDPGDEVRAIAGMLAFYDEKVDIDLSGADGMLPRR